MATLEDNLTERRRRVRALLCLLDRRPGAKIEREIAYALRAEIAAMRAVRTVMVTTCGIKSYPLKEVAPPSASC